MALGSWVISAFVNFGGNGGAFMQRLASQTTLANAQLARQQGLIDKNALAMQRYRARMDELWMSAQRWGTRMAGWMTLAGGAAMGFSLKSAGDLQLLLTSIQNITAASRSQMGQLYTEIFNVAARTNQTPQEAAQIFREIARQSQASPMSFRDMMAMLPYASQMGMVLHATRPEMSTQQVVDSTMALTHLWRQYNLSGMPQMFDTILRMSELMPSNLNQAVTQMKYFVPLLESLHVSDQDMAALMVLLSRTGMGRARGGTAVRAMFGQTLGPLQITSYAQAVKFGLLHSQLGLLDKNGRPIFFGPHGYDMLGLLDRLSQYQQTHKMAPRDFMSLLGAQGGLLAMVLADPRMTAMIHDIVGAMHGQGTLGLAHQSRTIWGAFNTQVSQTWKNFVALWTELGYEWLPAVTPLVKKVGDGLHNLQAWLHQHKGVERGIGAVVGALTGLAAIRFTAGSIAMMVKAASALGLIGQFSGGIAGFFRVLDAIFTGGIITRIGIGIASLATAFGVPVIAVVAGIAALAAAGYGIAQAVRHWPDIVKWFKGWSTPFLDAIKNFFSWLHSLLPPWLQNIHTVPLGKVPKDQLAPLYHPPAGRGPVVPGHAPQHINKVEIHVHDATDPKKIALAIEHILKNPLSAMYGADAKIRTHPNIPRAISTRLTYGLG